MSYLISWTKCNRTQKTAYMLNLWSTLCFSAGSMSPQYIKSENSSHLHATGHNKSNQTTKKMPGPIFARPCCVYKQASRRFFACAVNAKTTTTGAAGIEHRWVHFEKWGKKGKSRGRWRLWIKHLLSLIVRVLTQVDSVVYKRGSFKNKSQLQKNKVTGNIIYCIRLNYHNLHPSITNDTPPSFTERYFIW